MVENRIVAGPFDRVAFARDLTAAAGGKTPDKVPFVGQVKYLARYCKRLGAKTVLREDHYVDRHFLDEHVLYYGRSLEPTASHVVRFHVFSRVFSDAEFGDLLEQRAAQTTEAAAKIDQDLSKDYLGFISIRPLPSVPIGRTVLRRLDDGEQRDIWATGSHEVHLANIGLKVEGLAFQQQDLAVGACATAAVWTALSRVTRHEGMRAPTPAEVSQAAGRHVLPNGRTLPAVSGLSVQQLCEAIRSSGFAPEVVHAVERPEYFVVALHTYLLSGIPVVLVLQGSEGQHAVTAVGFKTEGVLSPRLQTSVPVRSARIKKIYIHDDRLGPYARSFLRPLPRTEEFGECLLLAIEKERDEETPDGAAAQPDPEDVEDWVLETAIVPVYPKLRLPARSLITLAELCGDLIEDLVGSENALSLGVEFYYERAGTYLSRLSGRVGPGAADFLRRVALPRWCGIVRWFVGNSPLAEFVYDTTDILRDEQRLGAELIRAIVCLDPRYRLKVARIAEFFAVPTA